MLTSILTKPLTLPGLLLCLGCSLVLGILTSLVLGFRHRNSASFAMTLAVLPMAMSMVVMMVNGNLGVAVSVAGGFTLVRFRSIAGTAREICGVFIVMTLGVICGMGYVGVACVFFVVMALAVLLLTALRFGEKGAEKLLRITVPEDYDYTTLFDDIFKKYGVSAEVSRVKTTSMGSLIEVTYLCSFPAAGMPKAMLDELRVRNANLSILLACPEDSRDSL